MMREVMLPLLLLLLLYKTAMPLLASCCAVQPLCVGVTLEGHWRDPHSIAVGVESGALLFRSSCSASTREPLFQLRSFGRLRSDEVERRRRGRCRRARGGAPAMESGEPLVTAPKARERREQRGDVDWMRGDSSLCPFPFRVENSEPLLFPLRSALLSLLDAAQCGLRQPRQRFTAGEDGQEGADQVQAVQAEDEVVGREK